MWGEACLRTSVCLHLSSCIAGACPGVCLEIDLIAWVGWSGAFTRRSADHRRLPVSGLRASAGSSSTTRATTSSPPLLSEGGKNCLFLLVDRKHRVCLHVMGHPPPTSIHQPTNQLTHPTYMHSTCHPSLPFPSLSSLPLIKLGLASVCLHLLSMAGACPGAFVVHGWGLPQSVLED